MSASDGLRCHHCSDLIGVYEPMVVLSDGVPVRTSRAAAGGRTLGSEPCFHAECFALRAGDEEPRDPC